VEIAFIHPTYPSSEGTGATHSATQVVQGLADAGHSVDVYCPDVPDEEFEYEHLDYHYLSDNSIIPHTQTNMNDRVLSQIKEFQKYDIVHSYLPSLIPSISKISKKYDVKTVVTLNAYSGVCPKNDLLYNGESNCSDNSTQRCIGCIARTSGGHSEYSAAYRMASRLGNLWTVKKSAKRVELIDAFRAPSRHVKENYSNFGYPEENIHVIPHPVDDKFLIDHESSFAKPYRLLYVGYLEEHKGVRKLIPILKRCQEELENNITLTIVGKGGQKSYMEGQTRDLGVVESVDFRGFIPNKELPAVYSKHDMFVYPGVWEEPLGRVYLEALATGTPIISSKYGYIKDIMGEGGVAVDGDVKSISKAIIKAIINKDLKEMSEKGKEKSRKYNLSTIISGIENIYKS
jgi:glycosyltransferase involved in cell wall biosynthesis